MNARILKDGVKRFVGGALIVVLASMGARNAKASYGAFAGRPLDGTPAFCYNESAGGVTGSNFVNPCQNAIPGLSPRWEIPLLIHPMDSGSGSRPITIIFAAKSDLLAGVDVCCQGISVLDHGRSIMGTQRSCATTSTYSQITLQGLLASSTSTLFLVCDGLMTPQTAVGSVIWF